MSVSTKIATPPKSTISRTRISEYLAVQIQIEILFNLYVYADRGIQVPGFGGVLGCSIFSGICHTCIHLELILLIYIVSILFEIYECGAYRCRRDLPIVQSDRER